MSEINQKLEKLQSVGIYAELSEEDAKILVEEMEEKHYSAGEIVVRAGEEGDSFYLILEGKFQAFLRNEEVDFEKELWQFGPGKHFGEIALFTEQKRGVNIRALTDGILLTLSRKILYKVIEKSPKIGLAFCKGIASYLQQNRDMEASIKFARIFDYPYIDELTKTLPPQISSYFKAIPVKREEQLVTIAMVDPTNMNARKFIREILSQYSVEFVAVSEDDYYGYLEKYLGDSSQISQQEEREPIVYETRHSTIQSEVPNKTTQLLDSVFKKAIHSAASDIHIEPWGKDYKIRLRIDGKMFSSEIPITIELYKQAISRLKIMAEVDSTNKKTPQDGSFNLHYGEREIEVRCSFLPCKGGEKAVLRVLDAKLRRLELRSLILAEPVAALTEELFLNPHGMILVTGPTGSGKTTTLYSGIAKIWEKGRRVNIITVEDPIEYQMEFTTQVQVNKAVGLDFAQILRTVLRQDPDVILVGEIRDVESAGTAVEAALTGHLVLSSLHTHFAVDAISRLRNLKIEPYLIAGALQGIISQRLVPRICPHCVQQVDEDLEKRKKLQELGILEKEDNKSSWSEGKGCDFCHFEGTSGRAGVFEMIQIDDSFRTVIEEGLPRHELLEHLTNVNFISMARYARFLLKEGIAAPESLMRVFPRNISLKW